MPFTSIVCGIILVVIGLIGYVHGVMVEKTSFTALIPAFFGIVLLLLGLVAKSKENLRKHLMHAAILVALLGFIGSLFSPGIKGTITTGVINDATSFGAQAAMAVTCLVFVILAVRSFAAARKNRG